MGAPEIDSDLVARLVRVQFPQWAELPVTRIEPGGWDNRSFRLGDDMVVRLPSSAAYAPQAAKEQHWLPILAPQLPVAIPKPLALGEPAEGYPWHWSIYAWLPGDTADRAAADDPVRLARSIAGFLQALHAVEPTGGPTPGPHNFYRGGPLRHYEDEMREAVSWLGDRIDTPRLVALWEAAAATQWEREPVWVHGDISPGNLLIRDGALSAVIDFGSCGVGDPARDLAIAWTSLGPRGRAAFRDALPLDRGTWQRGRAWALWKVLITLAGPHPSHAAQAEHTLTEILADPGELD